MILALLVCMAAASLASTATSTASVGQPAVGTPSTTISSTLTLTSIEAEDDEGSTSLTVTETSSAAVSTTLVMPNSSSTTSVVDHDDEDDDDDDDDDEEEQEEETTTATLTMTTTAIATTIATSTVTETISQTVITMPDASSTTSVERDDDENDDDENTTETTTAAVNTCENSLDFRDEFGHTCWFWNHHVCADAESWWGYSPEGQAEIFANCPRACGTCQPTVTTAPPCRNTFDFRDEHGFGCHAWTHSVCTDAEEGWGYTALGLADLIANCPVACGVCEPTPPPCHDTAGFVDEHGWWCRNWRFHNCEIAEVEWGYSSIGEIEILSNCPRACGLCDQSGRRHLR